MANGTINEDTKVTVKARYIIAGIFTLLIFFGGYFVRSQAAQDIKIDLKADKTQFESIEKRLDIIIGAVIKK